MEDRVKKIIVEKTLNIFADDKPEQFGKSLCKRIEELFVGEDKKPLIAASVAKNDNGDVTFSFTSVNGGDLTEEQQQKITTFLQDQFAKTSAMVLSLTKADTVIGESASPDKLNVNLMIEGNTITFAYAPTLAQEQEQPTTKLTNRDPAEEMRTKVVIPTHAPATSFAKAS